ncbi:unnamed protein product [Parajaminaea phylloscopi]
MAPPRFWRSRSQRSKPPPDEQPAVTGEGGQSSTHEGGDALESSIDTLRPSNAGGRADGATQDGDTVGSLQAARLSPSSLYIIVLTASLLGTQIVWSLELSYGTPYLLSLGLSPRDTSLVWLAGPVSGLIAQPLVGHLSDECSDRRYRRRSWMLGSTVVILISTLLLAYVTPIAEFIVDFLGIGLADWDPVRQRNVHSTIQVTAVTAFWLLDFALNALASSSRSLILDTLPAESVDRGNAWQGRMTHIGNVIGYSVGWLDLSKLAILRPLGGDQFRKYALIAMIGVIASVATTCICITEGDDESMTSPAHQTSTFSSASAQQKDETDRQSWLRSLRDSLASIWKSVLCLPRPVRRVCLVQVFSFLAWFPLLFYSTTYIGTFEPRGTSAKLREHRERKGTEGLLLFAIISLVAGSLLPTLSLSSDAKIWQWVSGMWSTSAVGASNVGKGVTLRTFWTASCLMHSFLFLPCTFVVQDTRQAIWLIALSGIPWSIACWVPYSLVMSFVREAEEGRSPYEFPGDYWDPQRGPVRKDDSPQSEGTGPQEAATGSANVRRALEGCEPLRSAVRRSDPSESRRLNDSEEAVVRGGDEAAQRGTLSDQGRGGGLVARKNRIGSSSRRRTEDESNLSDEHDGEYDEDEPLLSRSANRRGLEEDRDWRPSREATHGKHGTVLGIHNLFIVTPQLIVSLVASLIFSFFESSTDHKSGDGVILLSEQQGQGDGSAPGVVWVLRFGGLCMLVAAACTRLVPLVEKERALRGALS